MVYIWRRLQNEATTTKKSVQTVRNIFAIDFKQFQFSIVHVKAYACTHTFQPPTIAMRVYKIYRLKLSFIENLTKFSIDRQLYRSIAIILNRHMLFRGCCHPNVLPLRWDGWNAVKSKSLFVAVWFKFEIMIQPI